MKRQVIKIVSIPISILLGIFVNQFVTKSMRLISSSVGHGVAPQLLFLLALIVMIYLLIQFIVFRTQYWTRIEIAIGSIAYFIMIMVGLVFRGIKYSLNVNSLSSLFSLYGMDFNPVSFISDFVADHSSVYIAIINLVLFLPLPFIMSINRVKPRFGYAIILFVGLELIQRLLQQGFFSLGDITLYSLGFVTGRYLLSLFQQRRAAIK